MNTLLERVLLKKVPTIRHDFLDEWVCAAKVFVKGCLPIQLSHVFLHIALSDEELSNDELDN